MTDEERKLIEEVARERREADTISSRIFELRDDPIKGDFDVEHLKAVHAYIFQDYPEHQPGVTRADTASWVKYRVLEGAKSAYDVPYLSHGVEDHIAAILGEFGGADAIEGLSPDQAAGKIAELYGDLDHAHGFYEGNSRTLREFTQELAAEAGFDMDWGNTGVGAKERNALYIARDIAVMERAYPDLTPERAMNDPDIQRGEYEAFFIIGALRRAAGDQTLDSIIRDGLTPNEALEHVPDHDATQPVFVVADMATGLLESAVDFVRGFLAGGDRQPAPAEIDALDQIKAQRRAAAAIENIADSVQRGETLRAEDLQDLTPTHLENIRLRGDDGIRELVDMAERSRGRERDDGRER